MRMLGYDDRMPANKPTASWWAHVDPSRVPLPNGTEVETRVDRAHDDRVIPQGTVGRVQAHANGRFEVKLVGWGVVAFAREEIAPRKIGQARYAMRREAAWQALERCVVLDAVVGSRAWGLSDEGSDVDARGAFVLPFAWTIGLVDVPTDLVSDDGSATYWEIDKLVRQALRADPNTLELLFVPSVRARDEMGEWILAARSAFASQKIYGSFGRYALSQLEKLEQTRRLVDHRARVVEWVRADPRLGLDALAERLAAASNEVVDADARLRAKQHIQQLYRSMHDQGLLDACDLAALVRYAAQGDAVDELPREQRPKNAYNLLRLIATATEWLKTGEPRLRVEEPLREELLAIKRGDVALTDVLERAERMMPELERAREASKLPREPNVAAADALLRRIRAEAARRHFDGAAGPFGKDAPALPLAVAEEQP
jgi:hypothetical protein